MRQYTIILVAFALLQNAIAFPGSNQKQPLISSNAADLSCAAIYVRPTRNAQRSASIVDLSCAAIYASRIRNA
ncbi:hypothetical protein Pst134EA_033018 [Puccinia striiformis f. sp. tritici]|uniref:uncharacterized protein n=1 Tax=Puccinia striiformis f. sp. tritici TaxID=168172 RepID=UPI002008D100|nr:uncharacterized protein Pst134EA_033018 [Puccinia striiformis f. sp. tritici]KAH9443551.1 hypothetical protein Pst134EA_033018 [Puccinia striiformis f. sp. tritici]